MTCALVTVHLRSRLAPLGGFSMGCERPSRFRMHPSPSIVRMRW